MIDWRAILLTGIEKLEPLIRGQMKTIREAKRKSATTMWHYQLQDFDWLAPPSTRNYLVVDPYLNNKIVPVDLVKKAQSNGTKVFAYLSIGEAEDYRPYWGKWTTPPSWLDAENPQWKGNYKVKFWEPAWQRIVYAQLEQIVRAGFDGVYLDIVDAYEYYVAQDLMIDFVVAISRRAKAINPQFKIVPQNADALLTDANYVRHIDGIGCEDIWYGEDDDGVKNKDPAPSIHRLKRFIAQGKFVLSVEYLKDDVQIIQYANDATGLGFIWLVADRALAKPDT